MARSPRKSAKKNPRRKTVWRKRRANLAKSEFASAKQTIALPNNLVNTLYTLQNINLSQFDRMVQIARAYQFFRITKVEVKMIPYTDTFTTLSVPQLQYVINKSDSFTALTFNQLRDAGAKQIRFDDRSININWKPTVQVGVPISQPPGHVPDVVGWSSYRTSPWLATDQNPSTGLDPSTFAPSTVPHRGLLYGVEQDYTSTENTFYGMEMTVHFQFKKPTVYQSVTEVVDAAPHEEKVVVPKGTIHPPAPLLKE